MTDNANLRALAEKATPGPWEVDTNAPFSNDLTGIFVEHLKRYAVLFADRDQPTRADAKFIAAAHPQAVIALLDRIEAAGRLIRDFTDSDDCWFDHNGGCQAHGYLSLAPGELCPHAEAKRDWNAA